MLAIATTTALFIPEPHTLKRGTVPPSIHLSLLPTACAWISDGSALYLSSNEGVYRYDPAAESEPQEVLRYNEPNPNSQVIVKDGSTFITNDGRTVLIVDKKGKTLQTLVSHNSIVTSLSLASDSSLLACATFNAVHIHNLVSGSHTVLRGLPLAGQTIGACAFHPHSRTRLLLGIGKQFVVYDTTRPSGPIKVIPLDNLTSGDINAICSSPFSKSLVAVCTSEGYIGLVDLEKEKGLFRTLNLGVASTCISFSPEGASIYLGTDNGKLMIIDLRALEKPPKEIVIDNSGKCVVTIAVQSKSQAQDAPKKGNTTVTSKPLSNVKGNALQGRGTPKSPGKPSSKPVSAPSARVVKKTEPMTSDAQASDRKNDDDNSQISVNLEAIPTFKPAPKARVPSTSNGTSPKAAKPLVTKPSATASPCRITASAKPSKVSSPGKVKKDVSRRPRTLPTNLRAEPVGPSISSSSQLSVPLATSPQPKSVQRMVSSASQTGSETMSTASASSKARTVASRTSSSSSRPGSSISHRAVSPAPSAAPSNRTRGVSQNSTRMASRTPSPDLPGVSAGPAAPLPTVKKRSALSVLGLGTPEVNRWVEAGKVDEHDVNKGKGKGKVVGFKQTADASDNEDESDKENEGERSLVISPRRPGTMQGEWASTPSPSRYTIPASPGVAAAGSAQELLRTIVKDVMYDLQQETKSEMMGLHLDLVRMGRSWKKELRDLMDEYVGDLKDLREENRRLREENERLRRGY